LLQYPSYPLNFAKKNNDRQTTGTAFYGIQVRRTSIDEQDSDVLPHPWKGRQSRPGSHRITRDVLILAKGNADLVSFGTHFIANPDLVERFQRDLVLAVPDAGTFYSGGATGYMDYPVVTP
jgi:NADH:flavin oxidoreductase / NADH oxidase family